MFELFLSLVVSLEAGDGEKRKNVEVRFLIISTQSVTSYYRSVKEVLRRFNRH